MLYLRPVLVAPAKEHVLRSHRRLKRLAGAMWAIGAFAPDMIGVAVVGRPTARLADRLGRLELIRMAVVEGYPNACSMLYGACARAAKAMGAIDLWTFIHDDETGVTLRAAGWIRNGETFGGEWTRPSRKRAEVFDAKPKQRWCAPWSAMLTAATTEPGSGRAR